MSANTGPKGHLAKLIVSARHKIEGLTQPQVATLLGIRSAVSVCRWETDKMPVPPEHYLGLSRALSIPLESILSAADKDDPRSSNRFRELERQFNVKPSAPKSTLVRQEYIDALSEVAKKYRRATVQGLVDAALEFYIEHASRHGLDGNWHPNVLHVGQVSHHPSGHAASGPGHHEMSQV